MKKLAIIAACFASAAAFAASSPAAAPSSAPDAFSHAPTFLVVHNKVPYKTVATRDGRDSSPALPWTKSEFPWKTEVVPFCTNSNGKIAKPCDVTIVVLQNGKRINAGALSFNVKNGKIKIIPGDARYIITVNGVGEATITPNNAIG